VAITRELTKLHEEVVRGSVSEVVDRFERNPPRGEITLVVQGAEEQRWDQGMSEEALARFRDEGMSGSDAVREVAKLGRRPRNEVYRIWLSREEE